MRLITNNRKNSLSRPPDWRWQRAGELIQYDIPIRRSRDQNNITELYRFRSLHEAANTVQEQLVVIDRYPTIYDAWCIYDSPEKDAKWEIEARILAREPFESIAKKLATAPEVIEAFERYFFNVTDRLESPGYVTHQVFQRSIQTGLAERDYDLLWKMFGYWNGPAMLDAVIYTFNAPARPETADGVEAAMYDDFSFTALLKATKAVRTIGVNWQNARNIVEIYLELVAIEKNAGGGGGGQESIMAGLNLMLEGLPWTKYDQRAPTTSVEIVEQSGFGIRACEYELFSNGPPPPEYQRLIASAKFPEEKKDDKPAQADGGQ